MSERISLCGDIRVSADLQIAYEDEVVVTSLSQMGACRNTPSSARFSNGLSKYFETRSKHFEPVVSGSGERRHSRHRPLDARPADAD